MVSCWSNFVNFGTLKKDFYQTLFNITKRKRNLNIRILFIFISSPEPLGSQGELIVYPSSRRPSSVVVVVVNNFKHLLLQNRWADQSQILCGASLGRGNDILFAPSGSHDQDGRHAHIWSKPFKNLLLQNRRADFHETWYVASGTPAHHSLFKR